MRKTERICGFVGRVTIYGFINVLAFRYLDLEEVLAKKPRKVSMLGKRRRRRRVIEDDAE